MIIPSWKPLRTCCDSANVPCQNPDASQRTSVLGEKAWKTCSGYVVRHHAPTLHVLFGRHPSQLLFSTVANLPVTLVIPLITQSCLR